MKRLMAFILVFVLLVPNVEYVTAADSTSGTSGDYTYTLSGEEVTITGYSGSETVLDIPDQLDGYPVTALGNNLFRGNTMLTSVTVPDSVTTIWNHVFSGCTALTNVVLGTGVETLVSYVFANCTSLNTLTINSNIVSIGGSVFSNVNLKELKIGKNVSEIIPEFTELTSLTSITVDEENAALQSVNNILFSKDMTVFYRYPLMIKDTTYEIPETVQIIAADAFYAHTSLQSITIPEGVHTIGKRAFYGCTGLSGVILPETVTRIEDHAFYQCKSLTSFTVPENVSYIGNYAFRFCDSLTNLTIHGYIAEVESDAFTSTNVTNLHLGKSVTFVAQCFTDLNTLTSITVDEENTSFSSNDGILFNKDKTILCRYPEAKTGENYVVPDSVTEIGYTAFYGNTALTSITLPANVNTISGFAFAHCEGLTALIIEGNINSAEDNGFYYMPLPEIRLGKNVTSIADALKNIGSLTTITVDSENETFVSVDGVLYSKDMTVLYRYPESKEGTSYSIPATVETIEKNAFKECSSLTGIVINGNTMTVASDAFDSVKLSEIQFGSAVTKISSVFLDFETVAAFLVAQNNQTYAAVDGVLYSKDMTTLYRYPLGKAGTAYIIPDTVKKVEPYAFYETDLDSIVLPETLSSVGEYAFYNCTGVSGEINFESAASIGQKAFGKCTAITTLNFTGDAPSIGDDAFQGIDAVLYYDKDGSGWTEVMELMSEGTIWMVEKGTCSRAIALVLDCSASMSGKPMAALQDAAEQFCQKVLDSDIATQIVIVDYATKATSYGFTSKLEHLNGKISVLSAAGQTDLYGAVERADKYLSAINAVEKNMVIMADGMPQNGVTSQTGPYTSEDIGGYYLFANAICNLVEKLDKTYRIFTMGFYHSLETEELTFAKDFIQRIQNAGYYEVPDVDGLVSAFGKVASSVINPDAEPEETPQTTIVAKKNKTYKVGNLKYKVTNASTKGKGTVTFVGPKKKTYKTIKIPSTVKIGKVTYKVTAIGKNAFANNKKLTTITIGKYVKTIGTKAFYGCKKLRKIKISSSKITSVGKSAFKNVYKKVRIDVPKKKIKTYRKLFRKRSLSKKAKVY